EAVRRVALEHEMDRMLGIVGHTELILLEADLADDHDRTSVVVAGKGEERREIRRAPRQRLGEREGGKERKEGKERADGTEPKHRARRTGHCASLRCSRSLPSLRPPRAHITFF